MGQEMAAKIPSTKVHSTQPGKKLLWIWIPHGVSKWSGTPGQARLRKGPWCLNCRGLTFEEHINHIVKKANRLTGLMWRSFSYVDKKVFVTLYRSMIRPHLEYAASIWSPHTWKQAEEIEKIQRRATKRVAVLPDLPYEERLKALKLPTLVYRRLRGNLVNVYKYMNNLYDVKSIISEDKDDTRRGHSAKLEKLGCKKDIRLYFFSNRVVAWWNKIPQEVIDAPSIDSFKNRLDSHFKDHPMIYDYRALDNPVKPQMTVS